MSGIVPSASKVLTYLSPYTIRYCYYPRFMDRETKAQRAERACQGHMPGSHRAEIWLWTGCRVCAHIASQYRKKGWKDVLRASLSLCLSLGGNMFCCIFFLVCLSVFSTVDTHYPYVTRQIPIKMFKDIFLQI